MPGLLQSAHNVRATSLYAYFSLKSTCRIEIHLQIGVAIKYVIYEVIVFGAVIFFIILEI